MSARWLAAAALALGAHAAHAQGAPEVARGVRYARRAVSLADGATVVLHTVAVDLCDPAVELRATAPDEGGRRTSAWAGAVGATAAVNGDYFDERTLRPLGPARGAGRWWPDARREHRDALVLFARDRAVATLEAPVPGPLALWPDARTRVADPYADVVAVRERVLVDGAVRLNPRLPHDGRRHPRTALGLSADGRTLYLLVADGRSRESAGLTTRELALRLADAGARQGFKLDGGGSATLFLAGRGVVNHPSDGTERVVANHVGVIVRADVPAGTPRAWCRALPPSDGARSWWAPLAALAAPIAIALGITARNRS